MKIPLHLECSQCHHPAIVKLHLDSTSFDWTCDNCGQYHPSFFGLEVTVGFLLLERSRYELVDEQDFSMSIVLSAMALDAELSRLFRKWTTIEELRANRDLDEEKCETLLRRFKTSKEKITEVSELLYPGGIEAFVGASTDWSRTISEGFPSLRLGSLASDFQRALFWPRNRILHGGYAKHTEEDAKKCFSIAWLGLRILQNMDHEKRQTLT